MTERPLDTGLRYREGIRVYKIEVLFPGHARLWDDSSTGLLIETNLSPDNINNRTEKPILFNSDAAVWQWARRLQKRG